MMSGSCPEIAFGMKGVEPSFISRVNYMFLLLNVRD